MPGTLTNPSLPYYIEPKLVLISDPQVDEQAIIEATNAGIPIIGIANTDNITSNLDMIIESVPERTGVVVLIVQPSLCMRRML